MTKMTKISAGKYQHPSGAIIEKLPAKRIGRNGFALAGWAVIRNGREVSRWQTLKRATQEA